MRDGHETDIRRCIWRLAAASRRAQAQTFPSKPITVVIPLAAGGAVDTMVRTMIESMRATLGQPILVENMGGAGGTTGINRVARAAPDGYTISVGTWGTHVVNAFVYSPPYDLPRTSSRWRCCRACRTGSSRGRTCRRRTSRS